MTPPLAPRRERALERLETELPPGAKLERHPDRLVFHPPGASRARIGFFTTCVMEVMFPAINRDAVRLMVLAGCTVVVPNAQTCCGALHAHAGLRRTAKRLARRNLLAFGERYDAIVTDSAGCGAALREYPHLLEDDHDAARAFSSRVRDLSEVLAEHPLPAAAPLAPARVPDRPLRIAYHDPCHLAHAQRVRSQPRALLAALPNVELVDLPHSDWCCGSAGVYNLTHPEMAESQLERKLDSIEQVAPAIVVASNPGCMLHMARGARARGLAVEIAHLAQVLSRAYPPRPDAAAPAGQAPA